MKKGRFTRTCTDDAHDTCLLPTGIHDKLAPPMHQLPIQPFLKGSCDLLDRIDALAHLVDFCSREDILYDNKATFIELFRIR